MGCCCSRFAEPQFPKDARTIPITEVNCQSVYEPSFVLVDPGQDRVPLLKLEEPIEINALQSSDTSSVDNVFIQEILKQVDDSSTD